MLLIWTRVVNSAASRLQSRVSRLRSHIALRTDCRGCERRRWHVHRRQLCVCVCRPRRVPLSTDSAQAVNGRRQLEVRRRAAGDVCSVVYRSMTELFVDNACLG